MKLRRMTEYGVGEGIGLVCDLEEKFFAKYQRFPGKRTGSVCSKVLAAVCWGE